MTKRRRVRLPWLYMLKFWRYRRINGEWYWTSRKAYGTTHFVPGRSHEERPDQG